ncbi:MAG: hypothetical protein ACI9KE_005045 [Polyangiales bacterium]|jgi:hypothetical protein
MLGLMIRANLLVCLVLLFSACAQGGSGRTDSGPPPADVPEVDTGNPCVPACEGGETCVSGDCMPMSVCGPDGTCDVGQSCCPSGCSALPTDPTNCGTCGRDCGDTGDACVSGQCRCRGASGCIDGNACCEDGCSNLMESADNCGTCGMVCGDGQVCEAGDCVTPPCDPACTNDEVCDADASPVAVCMCGGGPGCATGQSCCGVSCIDTQLDRNNCGECGMVCNGAEVCLDGGCTTDVPCDPTCAVGETCTAGVCQCGAGASCGPGSSCCDDSCSTTQTDSLNCGRCGNNCDGDTCCAGACVNTANNEDNCGACGRSCGDSADRCISSACRCGSGPVCPFFPCTPFGCFEG